MRNICTIFYCSLKIWAYYLFIPANGSEVYYLHFVSNSTLHSKLLNHSLHRKFWYPFTLNLSLCELLWLIIVCVHDWHCLPQLKLHYKMLILLKVFEVWSEDFSAVEGGILQIVLSMIQNIVHKDTVTTLSWNATITFWFWNWEWYIFGSYLVHM